MSTPLDAAARREDLAGGMLAALAAAIKRSVTAYLARRAEAAAIAHLEAMSDRELHDIGVTRSAIPFAVRRGRPRDRRIRTYL